MSFIDGNELPIVAQKSKKLAMYETILGFENKGWALYEAPEEVFDINEVKDVIKNGPEKKLLKDKSRYIPLPYVKGLEDDAQIVLEAIDHLKNPICFVEFDETSIPIEYHSVSIELLAEEGIFPKVNAVYPIDSLSFNNDLAIVVDKRGMNASALMNIPGSIASPAIIIPYEEISKAIQYQINQFRTVSDLRGTDLEADYVIN